MNGHYVSNSASNVSARLVLLHGWGADANDLKTFGESIAKDYRKPLEVVGLNAPQSHPDGIGRQWYGLFPPDWESVPSAVLDLDSRLRSFSSSSIPLEKTVLLGFSQGAAMALSCGCNLPLAGVISCSGYSHPNWHPPLTGPPVFLTHGMQDDVVPVQASQKAIGLLEKRNIESDLFLFKGGHQIPDLVIPKIIHFLKIWINEENGDSPNLY